MSNRIVRVEVRLRSAAPSSAEWWVGVEPERLTPTTDVRGRLTGPRCPYAATVEVAHPLRPLPRPPEGLWPLTRRVVVPEASPWDPQGPFLYEGLVELVQDGAAVDRSAFRVGLRTLSLGAGGLRVNGRPLSLRGGCVRGGSEAEALAWRRAGWNLLAAPLEEGALALWDLADRYGFFVLGLIRGGEDLSPQPPPLRGEGGQIRLPLPSPARGPGGEVPDRALRLAQQAAQHPSCLGWLFTVGVAPWTGLVAPASPWEPFENGTPFVASDGDMAVEVAARPLLLLGGPSAQSSPSAFAVLEGTAGFFPTACPS